MHRILMAVGVAALSCATSLGQTLTSVLGHRGGGPLDSPTFVTTWPGDSKKLVVTERGSARVTLWDTHQVPNLTTTLLDLSSVAYSPTSFLDFIGVTAAVFHPEFLTDPTKRFLYVRYNGLNPLGATFVRRWTIPVGSQMPDPGSEVPIYEFPTNVTGHGSGLLQFDTRPNQPGTTLYVPMPDNAGVTDCAAALLVQGGTDIGKLLSVNVDVMPFNVVQRAKGFRNPFGFGVDPGPPGGGAGTGDVYLGDTGFMTTGNIIRWRPQVVPPFQFHNYGWPWREGDGTAPWSQQPAMTAGLCASSLPATPPPFTDPYSVFSDSAEFTPLGVRDAIIGGQVYRGSYVSSLTDRYVFGTYGVAGGGPRLYSLPVNGAAGVAATRINNTPGISNWGPAMQLHGFGLDWEGEILVIGVNEGAAGGQLKNGGIWRIAP